MSKPNTGPSADMISAYLDGELTASEREAVERRMAEDATFSAAVAWERAVRDTVRDRSNALRVDVPIALRQAIAEGIAREMAAASEPVAERPLREPNKTVARPSRLLRRPTFAIPVILISIVAGIAAVWSYRTFMATPPPDVVTSSVIPIDLHSKTYENWNAVVKGQITLAQVTSDTVALKEFFRKEGVQYDVFFPEIDAVLQGGVVSVDNGRKFAHLVYASEGHLVYIFEVDTRSFEDKTMSLPLAVAENVKQSKWHWEERDGVGTMFVWKSNNVVCSAVSDLPTRDFSALFRLEAL